MINAKSTIQKLILGAAALAFAAALAISTGSVQAATTVVTPANMGGWAEDSSGASDVDFVNGPGVPPLGTGSAEFSVDATGATGAQLRNSNYTGTRLAELTELSYSTYVQGNVNCQATYIILNIDNDNNGTVDDLLFFEPCYQTGSYGTVDPSVVVPSQCTDPNCVELDTWQEWDALNGGWWSLDAGTFGPPLTSIAFYISENPDATIVNSSTGAGGVRLVAGFGAGAWNNFLGNADAFTINTDTYDFELVNVPSSKDRCKKGGWMSMTDNNGSSFKNQGDCVSYVATGGTNPAAGPAL